MEMPGKVVIVSGATSGIGREVALRFAREGARVVILGLDDTRGQEVQTALQLQGAADCFYRRTDVSDGGAVQAAVAEAAARWGRVDVLVNNAAIMHTGALADMSEADWDKTMAVNLKGPFLLAKHALPAMPPGSSIVNISSVHAIATDVHSTAYSASKGGLEAFTRALALECHARKIRVNALRLGAVDTPMLWNNPDVRSGEEKVDASEVASPGEVAELVLFLASARSQPVTGAVLTADGGRLPILGSHAH